MRIATLKQQSGAVIVTVAFTLLFLLGFMAIAIDFGHLFVVKTEMQTAVDSCALAAAQELDGGSDALTRAANVGVAVGNLNNIDFQGDSPDLVASDVTFSDALNGAYSATFSPVANAKYARCTHTKTGMAPWLLQAMRGFTGRTAYSDNQSVWALAVATRTSAQSVCNALPVQIRPKPGGTAPDYGYTSGEWIPSLYDESASPTATAPGHFGWANLDGSTSASETKAEVLGNTRCNLVIGGAIGTPGAKVAARTEWNSRFGLYVNGAGNPKIGDAPPDITGYSYTPANWPSRSNAVGDFLAKRAGFRSYGDTTDTIDAGNTITGLTLSNSYKDDLMGAHSTAPNLLSTYGRNRRLVLAPIVTTTTITDWACVLMLHPIDGPNVTVYLEYVGNGGSPSSPCASPGLAGGSAGPLVPALVQ